MHTCMHQGTSTYGAFIHSFIHSYILTQTLHSSCMSGWTWTGILLICEKPWTIFNLRLWALTNDVCSIECNTVCTKVWSSGCLDSAWKERQTDRQTDRDRGRQRQRERQRQRQSKTNTQIYTHVIILKILCNQYTEEVSVHQLPSYPNIRQTTLASDRSHR